MRSSHRVLTTRELNRSLLQRQLLLRRRRIDALEMVERLVGLQAQVPRDPYVALWSRIDRFRPESLAEPMADRRAVRMTLLRGTLHLVTAADALALRPVIQPVVERSVFGSSPLRRVVDRVDLDELLAFLRSLLEERPRTRAELVKEIAARWPDVDAASLGYAMYLLPTVQVTPRGIWGQTGPSAFTTVKRWLGRSPARSATPDTMVLRYLAAFGPSTPADVQTWCGLPGTREVLERLRPRLRTFLDEQGRELFDAPGTPLPKADVSAPVRFLPEYDNAFIAHADRSRILPPGVAPWTEAGWGPVLVDGFSAARWRLERAKDAATLRIEPFRTLSRPARDGIGDEAEGLMAFLAPDARVRQVRFRRRR
jgi:hypothetical protein